MRRLFPWLDVLIFGGIALLMTGAAVGAFLTPQDWTVPAAILMVLVPVVAWGVVGSFILQWWRSKPDVESVDGWLLWVDGLPVPEIYHEVGKALRHFRNSLSGLASAIGVSVAPDDLSKMIAKARIEIVKDKVKYGDREYSGLQRGYGMRIQWLTGCKTNAFFHELLHMVDEAVLRVPTDYKHTRSEWWALVKKLKSDFDV